MPSRVCFDKFFSCAILFHIKTIADSSLFACVKIDASLVAFMLFDQLVLDHIFQLEQNIWGRRTRKQVTEESLSAPWLVVDILFNVLSCKRIWTKSVRAITISGYRFWALWLGEIKTGKKPNLAERCWKQEADFVFFLFLWRPCCNAVLSWNKIR